jgi:hypothetical protein
MVDEVVSLAEAWEPDPEDEDADGLEIEWVSPWSLSHAEIMERHHRQMAAMDELMRQREARRARALIVRRTPTWRPRERRSPQRRASRQSTPVGRRALANAPPGSPGSPEPSDVGGVRDRWPE